MQDWYRNLIFCLVGCGLAGAPRQAPLSIRTSQISSEHDPDTLQYGAKWNHQGNVCRPFSGSSRASVLSLKFRGCSFTCVGLLTCFFLPSGGVRVQLRVQLQAVKAAISSRLRVGNPTAKARASKPV